jgi:O-antigen/teichoic acid export membrane protein
MQVALYALGLLFATVDGTGLGVLRVFDKFMELSLWQIGVALLKFLLVVAALLMGWQLEGVLVAFAVTALAGALGLLYLVGKTVKATLGARRARIGVLRESYKELAHSLFHISVGSFWGTISRNLDVLLLGWMHNSTQVGYYKMAKTFVLQLALVTDPLYYALFPELTKMWARGNVGAYNRFIKNVTLVAGAVMVAGALVFSLLAPWFVTWTVGEAFLPSVPAMRIMVWGVVIAVALVWNRPTIIAIGKPQTGHLISLTKLGVYLLASWITVPRWGYIGTSWVFVLSYVYVHAGLTWGYLWHLWGRRRVSNKGGHR